MKKLTGLLYVCVATAPLLAQSAETPPAIPAASFQQRYNAAVAKQTAGDLNGALADFTALEASLQRQGKAAATNLALIRAKKAEVLEQLGRLDEGRDALKLALGGGGLDSPVVVNDRDNAGMLLGRMLEMQLDHAAAAAEYQKLADTSATASMRGIAFIGMARTRMFTDAATAARDAEQALAIFNADRQIDKTVMATAYGIYGRILLNAGRLDEARKMLDRAIEMRGGLDRRVDVGDVAIRTDAAIAALRAGHNDDARRLMAYTGAGRSEEQLMAPGVMPLPQCGGSEDLRPDDVAIIQFAILADGRVSGAQPVYASRQGEMAYAFARAVNGWSWSPAAIAKLPIFYRMSPRVEVRCSSTFNRPTVMRDLVAALDTWFAGKLKGQVFPIAAETDAAATQSAQAALDGPEAQNDTILRAALWSRLALSASVGSEAAAGFAQKALEVIRPAGAPPRVWLPLEIIQRTNHIEWRGDVSSARAHVRAVTPLLEDAQVVADPAARATVRLLIVEYLARARDGAGERTQLQAVIDDAGLATNDPLKIAALIALANVEIAQGNDQAARSLYERTGLSARQCASLDTQPVMLRSNVSGTDFPGEAQVWGFEGWTQQEYDIGADGRTMNVRTTAAFPPAVFVQAGQGMARNIRYRPSFRPEGGLGCGGVRQRFTFRIPG